MPHAPLLVLVDPRAQRRAALRQRLLSISVGLVLIGVSAIPLLQTLGR